MNKQNLGLILGVIVIGLKFFSIIDLTWTIVILFSIAFLAIDLSSGFLINIFHDMAFDIRSLSNKINELKSELEELKNEVESLQSEMDNF